MELDSFEVIHEEKGESLTTTMLDDLTKVYEERQNDETVEDATTPPPEGTNSTLKRGTEMSSSQDSECPATLTTSTSTPDPETLRDDEDNVPEDDDLDPDLDDRTTNDLLENLHQQTSTVALLRDRTTYLNSQLSSLISNLPFAKPSNHTPLNRNLALLLLSTILLTSALFLIHTYLYSQILTSQGILHANMTSLEREALVQSVEQRDQLREYLMHQSYENARVSEGHLRECGLHLERVAGDWEVCKRERDDLEMSLRSCQGKMGRVDEYRRVLIRLKKENDRLRGILGIGSLGLGAWVGIKWFLKKQGSCSG